jgi:molybdenum cofactor synthesis domain-containing protein
VSERSALVITASTRAAAGIYPDTAGPELVEGLRRLGFVVDGPQVVPDGEPVDRALRDSVRSGYDLVLTTGGTGLSPQDVTPDLTRGILDREVPVWARPFALLAWPQALTPRCSHAGSPGWQGTRLL